PGGPRHVVTPRRAAALVAAVGLLAAAALWLAVQHHAAPSPAASEPVRIIHLDNSHDQQAVPTLPPPVSHDGLRIRLPQLGIDLPIVEGDGYNAPLYKAVQYPGTAWPGEGGRSVIYAHARAGMFGPLFGAGVGMHIEITGPTGVVQRYVVTQYFSRWPVTDLRWLRPGDH